MSYLCNHKVIKEYKILSKKHYPQKGNRVTLGKEFGVVMDNNFQDILWDNGKKESWNGLFGSFFCIGGRVISEK